MYFKETKGFPKDFLWGSASAAYQVEGRAISSLPVSRGLVRCVC